MTVGQLLASITSVELSEWMALRQLENAERVAEERKGKRL